jgi:signal transduction histidine kinase
MRRLLSGLGSVFTPSLRRTLLLRSLAIGLVPVIVIVALALGISQRLLQERFDDEAGLLAGATASSIDDRITSTFRAGAVLAAFSTVRELTDARDARALRELLIPLKSRLALDLAYISDANGVIIAGAQDFNPGDTLPPELVIRAKARAENSWLIYSHPRGLMIQSITPISSADPLHPPGYVSAGSLLDSGFLKTVRASSDSEIAMIDGGEVRVSTLPTLKAEHLPDTSNMALTLGAVTRDVAIEGTSYTAIFSLVKSASARPQILVTLLPLGPLEDAQRQLAAAMVAGGIVLALAAVFFSYRTARAMTTPLARLAGAAQRIEAGDLETPIAVGSEHEIGQLEHSFRSMRQALASRDGQNATLVGELRATNVKLEEASRLKSEFIANVSHELRTPMNAILGYTDFILEGLDGPVNAQQTSDLQRVHVAADNLLGIINGLLDLAKIEAGQMDVQPKRFRMNEISDEVVSLLAERATAKGLELRSEIGSDVIPVWADPYQVRQVLTNLAANAVKFTNAGEIVISASPVDDALQVTVRDTGEGIPSDSQQLIFDEFRQADASSTRRHGGTGLGLAIARRLVMMNGGRIWVESEVGTGSRFHFTLPTKAAGDQIQRESSDPTARATTASQSTRSADSGAPISAAASTVSREPSR